MFSLCEVCDQRFKTSTFTTETYPDVASTYSLKDKKGLNLLRPQAPCVMKSTKATQTGNTKEVVCHLFRCVCPQRTRIKQCLRKEDVFYCTVGWFTFHIKAIAHLGALAGIAP